MDHFVTVKCIVVNNIQVFYGRMLRNKFEYVMITNDIMYTLKNLHEMNT